MERFDGKKNDLENAHEMSFLDGKMRYPVILDNY
jgi:hypothetical protein